MPTYDYRCKECGYTFEAFQQMTAAPLTACPQCKGALKRLIGAGAGLIFKGKGFYATDYKRKDVGSTQESKPAPCPSAGTCPSGGSCPKADA